MAKRQAFFSPDQGDLFQRLTDPEQQAVDLDIHQELIGAISQCIREAKHRGLSRDRIVNRMNMVLPDLERRITKRQLDCWTATSKEYSEFPARYLPAFCWAVDCDLPLRVLAGAIGRDLVDARDGLALRLGQINVNKAQLTREERALRAKLGG